MENEKKERELTKPLSVLMTEVKRGIVTIINDSGLPVYITELILKDIYNEVLQVSNQVKDSEYQSYIVTKKEETH